MRDKITLILMILLVFLIVVFHQVRAQIPSGSSPCYAGFVASFTPGTTKAGTIVVNGNETSVVTGDEIGDESSISLGIGGEMIIGFSSPVPLGDGDDLLIDERDDSGSNEKIDVYVSNSLDDGFELVGSNISGNGFINVEIPGFTEVKYVKLIEVSDTADFTNDNANGYDLDRVISLHGCGTSCDGATLSTASLDDVTEEGCFDKDAAVTLTGEGPWQLGYTNGQEVTWAEVATPSATIPLTLSDQTWLTWVTDKNECTSLVNDSDTLTIAPATEAYFRASYMQGLTNSQQCNAGNGRFVPLVLRGKSPWNVIYTVEQGRITKTDTLKVERAQFQEKDTYYWDILESGSYQLKSVEDQCGVGKIIPEIIISEGDEVIDTVKTNAITLVDISSAKFLDPDTVCTISEEASLKVALTGEAPWQLTWEVEGVEYSESKIATELFTIPIDLAGKYTLKSVRGVEGCEGFILEDSIVDVLTPVTAQLFKKSGEICNPSEEAVLSVKLNGAAPFTFAYALDGDVVDTVETTSETYEIPITKSGTYQLEWVKNACGSGNVEGQLVIDAENQAFNAINYEIVNQGCNTVTLQLQADSLFNDFEYEWYSDGRLVGNESGIQFTAIIGSNLNVSLVTKLGACTDSVSSIIPIETFDTGNLGRFNYSAEGDPTCEGQTFTFSSDSVNSLLTYQWKIDGELVGTEANFTTQLSSGSYSVQLIINDGSCLYSSQRRVDVLESDESALANFSYTLGEPTSCDAYPVALEADTEKSGFSYRWLVNGEEVGQETTLNYNLATGESEIILEASQGECQYTSNQMITIEGESLPNAGAFDLATEAINCDEWSLSANALDFGEELQYEWWLNGELISDQERISTTLNPGEYILRLLTQIGGCRYEVEETISIASAESLINVPNVLSPQAAHPDDQVIKVYGNCLAESGFVFQIMNRWGDVAYETKSREEATQRGWDGGNHSSGIYTYILRGQFDNGTSFKKQGTITLLK
ncbi:MAG: hypothetical protein AAF632_24880 [Bacteroidota bacterium]